jgi:serine protease
LTIRAHPRAFLALVAVLLGACAVIVASAYGGGPRGSAALRGDFVPGEVVVGYRQGPLDLSAVGTSRMMGARAITGASPEPGAQVLRLPAGEPVAAAIARLRRLRGVAYAVPDYIAHIAGSFIPNDPGRSHLRGGWEKMQWNFLEAAGVDAPGAWANLIADRRPGGRGVVVAVLDTGVAYRDWETFTKSPDFGRTRFVAPYDFVAHNRFPLDREGHGTFIAGEIAESTNNRFGLTGLSYGASIMPVRVLAADGTGDAATIARGIRYAVNHHARVINLSLEFELGINARDIPEIISAVRYAGRHGVVVVGAAGNDEAPLIAYPARAPGVIAVGATTRDRCLAWYSDVGHGLALVAPGGDYDASVPSDSQCHPNRNLPPIYQLTFVDPSHPDHFGYPGGIYGTSMAAGEVAATAALVIASGVLGRHPSPAAILNRLEQTAVPLGASTRPDANYGWGLLNAAAATAPGGESAARR